MIVDADVTRRELVEALIADGWRLEDDGDYRKLNFYVSLDPWGAEDDIAVIGTLHRERLYVSFAEAQRWAADIVEFAQPQD